MEYSGTLTVLVIGHTHLAGSLIILLVILKLTLPFPFDWWWWEEENLMKHFYAEAKTRTAGLSNCEPLKKPNNFWDYKPTNLFFAEVINCHFNNLAHLTKRRIVGLKKNIRRSPYLKKKKSRPSHCQGLVRAGRLVSGSFCCVCCLHFQHLLTNFFSSSFL